MKLDVNLIGLCVSMLLSGWCLGIAHFYYGNSPQGVYMLLMMIFPGLTGWNGNSFFDKFYKVQNFFPYAIPDCP